MVSFEENTVSFEENTGLIGVMLSGGIDSSILAAHLADQGRQVQPFYVQSGLYWQAAELRGLNRFLSTLRTSNIRNLVVLDLPLGDIYDGHWSLTGTNTPDASTSDDAVYLPSRNALLLIKAAVWCQRHRIRELALATLGSSPFEDATSGFRADFEQLLNRNGHDSLEILCPFGTMTKRQVMELGRDYPLESTFSCIAPADGLHCGECNKCEERRNAFALDARPDKTAYASDLQTESIG